LCGLEIFVDIMRSSFVQLLVVTAVCSIASLHASFDNKFIPWIPKWMFMRTTATKTTVVVQPFFMAGDKSWPSDDDSMTESVGLFELGTRYNMVQVDNALSLVTGEPSHIRSDLRARYQSINWAMNGTLQGQGLLLRAYQELFPHVGLGADIGLMHIQTALQLDLLQVSSVGDRAELFNDKTAINQSLGLTGALSQVSGMSDGFIYGRVGAAWDYGMRVRHGDLGFLFGVVTPMAPGRDQNNPASISLGGERHWGVAVEGQAEIELKRDMWIGMEARCIKRFARTSMMRVPVLLEPDRYGADIAPVNVEPGPTWVLSPHVAFTDLREGWGFFGQYLVEMHEEDNIIDERPEPHVTPLALSAMQERSSWAREQATVGVTYNAVRSQLPYKVRPFMLFSLDIPVRAIVSKRSAKTYGISFMLECDF
jgi:hypothetical protein